MSAEFKDSRDKDGFLKCKECPRRFLTKLAFENHSSHQHNQEIETKLDQLPQPPPVKYSSDCFLCHVSFQSEMEVQQHMISAHGTPLKFVFKFKSINYLFNFKILSLAGI